MIELPGRRSFLQTSFLQAALAAFPMVAMTQETEAQTPTKAVCVKHDADRFNEALKLGGANTYACKVSTKDTNGALFLLEQRNLRKGGPPRHVHHRQDEWFYILDGEFIAEVGTEKFRLEPGDSLFAPRRVPHAFARAGENDGRLLIGFQPAGEMKHFFHEIAKMPDYAKDEKLYQACGMELVGPPLPVD
ncbi:MAG: cupin domain-containing protein [Candidatus Acidiferrum sp.]